MTLFVRDFPRISSTMENQGSTSYLLIQLSVVKVMPWLRCHTSCILCGAMVFSY